MTDQQRKEPFDEAWAYLEKTGDWSTAPWWERPDLPEELQPFRNRLRKASTILRRYFDAEWARDFALHPRKNLVFPELCIGGSTSAARFVSYLGQILNDLGRYAGIEQKIGDLKGEKSDSAFFELEVAHAFHENGFSLEFPREGGSKSPDILTTKGNLSFAVECKRLQSEIWENWETELTQKLFPAMSRSRDGKDLAVQIALNPRLTEVRLGDDNDALINAAFIEAIIEDVTASIDEVIVSHEPPIRFSVHELADITISHRDGDVTSSLHSMERTSPSLFRRIFQNGVLRAQQQLPAEVPGVICVYSKFVPHPQFTKLFLDAAYTCSDPRFSNVVAIMICSLQTIFQRARPFIYPNAGTPHIETRDAVLSTLKKSFGAIELNHDGEVP